MANLTKSSFKGIELVRQLKDIQRRKFYALEIPNNQDSELLFQLHGFAKFNALTKDEYTTRKRNEYNDIVETNGIDWLDDMTFEEWMEEEKWNDDVLVPIVVLIDATLSKDDWK